MDPAQLDDVIAAHHAAGAVELGTNVVWRGRYGRQTWYVRLRWRADATVDGPFRDGGPALPADLDRHAAFSGETGIVYESEDAAFAAAEALAGECQVPLVDTADELDVRTPDELRQTLRERLHRPGVSRQRVVAACPGLDERVEGGELRLTWPFSRLFVLILVPILLLVEVEGWSKLWSMPWWGVLVLGTMLVFFAVVTVGLVFVAGDHGRHGLALTRAAITIQSRRRFRARWRTFAVDEVRAVRVSPRRTNVDPSVDAKLVLVGPEPPAVVWLPTAAARRARHVIERFLAAP